MMQVPSMPVVSGTKRKAAEKNAEIAFKRLITCMPARPKRQSLYVRFKYILLQDASVQGEKEMVANMTELAKDKWKIVKNVDTKAPHHGQDNKENSIDPYLVDAKRRAEEDEQLENNAHSKAFRDWCERFQAAASAHLSSLATEAHEENYTDLKETIYMVENIKDWSEHVPKFHLFALAKAKEELEDIEAKIADKALVNKLRDATLPELYKHAKEYRKKDEKIKKMESIKAQLNNLRHKTEQQDRLERDRDNSMAATLVGDIVKNLSMLMVYDAALKTRSKRIVYERSGVKPQVFCAAFNVASGSKKAAISSYEVPCKLLRYGTTLVCGDVEVKLNGSGDLVATAWYAMHTNRVRYR